MATYEIVLGTAANSPVEVIEDVPPAEIGEVIFHRGHFWRVEEIKEAQLREVDGRLIVTQTTDEPRASTE